jgi:NAD(P)-dependent dehydrogenase (short-subunit alcohol dehydrogenase family)
MNLELRNKTVFIAGGGRGIGFGIARAFLAEGARVVITGRNTSVLESAEAQLRDLFPQGELCAVAGGA